MFRKALVAAAVALGLGAFAPVASAIDLLFDYRINSGATASVATLSLTEGSSTDFSLLATLGSGGGDPGIIELYWGCNGCGSPSLPSTPSGALSSLSMGSFNAAGYNFDFKATFSPALTSGSVGWTLTGAGPASFLEATADGIDKPTVFALLQITGGQGSGFYAALIPEPGTYAMLLAGLGLLGFIARRRMRG